MIRTFVLRSDVDANELWAYLKAHWRNQAQCGKPVSVAVSQHKEKRSQQQNARYWKILSQVSDGAIISGKKYKPESWAELFKEMFIGLEELPNSRYTSISTTTLSVEEFSIYMDKIEAYAVTELGINFEGI